MIYLDHNATTPVATSVADAMREAMTLGFGNAASSHAAGRAAALRVKEAAGRVANLLGVPQQRLVWTSGATESLNTAMRAVDHKQTAFLATRTEHRAVLDVLESLEEQGRRVRWLGVGADGALHPGVVAEALAETRGTAALVVTAANNETGVVNDVASLAELVHDAGGLVICDATQRVGKMSIDLSSVDFAAASAHKLYGPQGVGALVVPSGRRAQPLILGGGHQRGWRSGTLNVPGIVGFGVAAELALSDLAVEAARLAVLRDQLLALLVAEIPDVAVNGDLSSRLPNTLNIHVPGVPADALIVNCPEVAFSSGSACTTSVPTPSHVLLAMGLGDKRAEESVRLSLGRGTGGEDIVAAARQLVDAASRIRDLVAEEAG
jgi:cysteine desulfurase